VSSRQQLQFALVALVAGIAWGLLRHRDSRHRRLLGVLQGLEWFIAYGGALALIEGLRRAIEDDDEPEELPERVTHIQQIIAERTGTEG
jgi:hypothetical protein